ncbi:hypothetical protein IQ274_27805 [Nostoc sp. LEGE 12447]|uniref:DUF6519 domain-containing protein n=1 Tax=Nostoc sp. LEGE 12447 TaxID=1828640 RepID=UPI001689CA85|nr:DUF6519 domain-containing protein [Nostoc sp. LEGE 12447]MBD2511503.1 hypothetical protein [Desmonostoc muscorum FACHB-395]MBE9001903.1 hypothetical protein [Nostoc sp. LEGE 12447]
MPNQFRQGEFKGDFTRDTFDPKQNFLRVLMQQGRVQIDADWNEQISILLHYLQTLATDIIGPHGGPINAGFKILVNDDLNNAEIRKNLGDFQISQGHYYVNGILCENHEIISYLKQNNYPLINTTKDKPSIPFLVYLDVWERHITYIENPKIREVALGGVDTGTRSQVIWQVKTQRLENNVTTRSQIEWDKLVNTWQPENRGLLQAQAKIEREQTEACLIKPDAAYRGEENQLYRVEIHTDTAGEVTFKWSRENASVIFPIEEITLDSSKDTENTTVTIKLQQWWQDDRFGLAENDWVELVDDDYVLHQWFEPLWQVTVVNFTDLQLTLKSQQAPSRPIGLSTKKYPFLRRWEQQKRNDVELKNGAIAITEAQEWFTLEKGVQIKFPDFQNHSFRTGDYWLIPARTATGDVEWPSDNDGKPQKLPPHGVYHSYAPLALFTNSFPYLYDCRRQFYTLSRNYEYLAASWGIGANLIEDNDYL